MRKITARTICALLTLAMLLMLAACSTPQATTSPTAAPTAAPNTPAPAATAAPTTAAATPSAAAATLQPATLTLMDFITGNDPGTVPFKTSLQSFKTKYPQITINEEALQIDDYETKIKTLAAANELPSVFNIKGSWIANFADDNLIAPMDDALNQDPDWKNSYLDGSFDDLTYNNHIWAVPFELDVTTVLYYNKDIFTQCGVTSFPTTWADFLTACQKIKSSNYTPIVLGDKSNWMAESCILSALADRFTGTDWFYSIQNKKGAKFTDPDFVNSLKALQQLIDAGAFNSDAATIDENEMQSLYFNKKAAMMVEGSWSVSGIIANAPKDVSDATDVGFLPSVDGGKGKPNAVAGGTGSGYGMKAGLSSAEAAAAAQLVKAFTDKDNAQLAYNNNSFAPVKPSLIDSSKLAPLAVNYMKAIEGRPITPIYDARLSPAVIEVMCNDLQQLFIKSKTPEQVAQDIETEYESEK